MESFTGLFLAIAVATGWSVDGQTDQRRVEKLRRASAAGRVEELGRGIAEAPPELLDALAQSATCAGQVATLRLLVEKGARAARFGPGGLLCLLERLSRSEIDPAVWEGVVVEIEQFLLEKGMSLRGRFDDGRTVLDAAVATCRAAWVAPLLDGDADVNNRANHSGATTLMRAVHCPEDVVGPLLRHGAERSAKDRSGGTAMMHLLAAKLDEAVFRERLAALVPARPLEDPGALLEAARRGNAVAVAAMLEAGASAAAADKEGNTPLHFAAAAACPRCVDALLAKGARTDAVNGTGDTPLHLAAALEDGCPRCIEPLLAKGAKVDARNQGGATPLHRLAARCGGARCEASVKLLIAAGADLGARDGAKLSPFDVALKSAHASRYGQLLGKLEFKPLASLGAAVSASGTLAETGRPADFYAPSEAVDGSAETCWCVRDPKVEQKNEWEFYPGWEPYRGVWAEVRLPKPARVRAARVYPGCSASRSIYEANNRVGAFRFDVGSYGPEGALIDEMRYHDLPVEHDAPVDRLRLWVLSVFPGKKFPDTCIAEIQAILEEAR